MAQFSLLFEFPKVHIDKPLGELLVISLQFGIVIERRITLRFEFAGNRGHAPLSIQQNLAAQKTPNIAQDDNEVIAREKVSAYLPMRGLTGSAEMLK